MSTFRQNTRSNAERNGYESSFKLKRRNSMIDRISGPAFIFPSCERVPFSMNVFKWGAGMWLARSIDHVAASAFARARVEMSVARIDIVQPEEKYDKRL